MPNKFVLDENVIISASTFKDENCIDDYSSSTLLNLIACNGHSLLVTQEIYSRYIKQYHKLVEEKKAFTDIAIKILTSMMASGKIVYENYCEIDLPEQNYHRKDDCFIKLAMNKNSIVATLDNSLIDDIKENEIDITYHFEIKRPSDAHVDAS